MCHFGWTIFAQYSVKYPYIRKHPEAFKTSFFSPFVLSFIHCSINFHESNNMRSELTKGKQTTATKTKKKRITTINNGKESYLKHCNIIILDDDSLISGMIVLVHGWITKLRKNAVIRNTLY